MINVHLSLPEYIIMPIWFIRAWYFLVWHELVELYTLKAHGNHYVVVNDTSDP